MLRTYSDELYRAEKEVFEVEPLTKRDPNLTVDDAYQIQLLTKETKEKNGLKVIGKKVGLTSKAMQAMLNVDEPDYGHLFDDMIIQNDETILLKDYVSPKIEAEIGFVLKKSLKGPNVTFIDVLLATDYVLPTIEIIDSRIKDWDITLTDTVADNGSSAKVVVGDEKVPLDGLNLRTLGMTLEKNGDILATGAGAAALSHPAEAIAWLANTLAKYDIALEAGELILPGALTGAVSVESGDQITARFEALGEIRMTFQ